MRVTPGFAHDAGWPGGLANSDSAASSAPSELDEGWRRPCNAVPNTSFLELTLDMVATWGYFAHVKAVAVKELKNRLSQYLREVATGEVVLVTDRGRVVAELRRPSTDRLDFDLSLEPLASQGLLQPGLPQDPRAYRRSGVTLRRPSQALLDAERAES